MSFDKKNKNQMTILFLVLVIIVLLFVLFSNKKENNGVMTFVPVSGENAVEYSIDFTDIQEESDISGKIYLGEIQQTDFINSLATANAGFPSFKGIFGAIGRFLGISKPNNSCTPTISPDFGDPSDSTFGVRCGFRF